MSAALAVVEPEAEEKEPSYEFDDDFQHKVMALALRDTTFVQKTEGLVIPAYFGNDADAALVNLSQEYFAKYRKAPDLGVLGALLKDAIAAKRVRSDMLEDVKERMRRALKADLSDREYVIDKVAEFAKNRAVERAMIASLEALGRKDYGKIESLMAEALKVGVQHTETYDYWEQIEQRTARRNAILTGAVKPEGITTGYAELDKYLLPHLGWGRKELALMLGAAKAGKSMSLGDFGKNASLAGKNVLYASCEVSKEIISDRCDANVSDTAIKTLGLMPADVEARVKAARGKAGAFEVLDFPSGMLKPSELRRILDRYRSHSKVFDLIIVDYLDIMAPDRWVESERENLKNIGLSLRAIGHEQNAAMLSATQSNREGGKALTTKAEHVAEDINKVRTVDVLLSINSTEEERAAGEARIYFAAMRNSEDHFTLRIKQDRAKMKFLTKILGRE